MIIAVNFDGTIVEHKFPEIGRLFPFAIESLELLQKEGHQIILWTCREGRYLHDALSFLSGEDFYPNAVNDNLPDGCVFSRKIYADLYIDDRNVGFGEVVTEVFWENFYHNLVESQKLKGGIEDNEKTIKRFGMNSSYKSICLGFLMAGKTGGEG